MDRWVVDRRFAIGAVIVDVAEPLQRIFQDSFSEARVVGADGDTHER